MSSPRYPSHSKDKTDVILGNQLESQAGLGGQVTLASGLLAIAPTTCQSEQCFSDLVLGINLNCSLHLILTLNLPQISIYTHVRTLQVQAKLFFHFTVLHEFASLRGAFSLPQF